MVNSYFDCIKLIKKCTSIVTAHAALRKVKVIGPIFTDPLDKYYFYQLYSDERRYGQIILNFLSNGIKFSTEGGIVSVLLRVTEVTPNGSNHESSQKQK